MNRKLLLVLVVVLLGGIAWWLQQRSAASTLDQPLSDFAVPDTASVDRIFIADPTGNTIDLRRANGYWSLNERYIARQSDIELLLKTFRRVEVKSPVPKKAQATALRIMGAAAKRVEIYQGGDKPSKVWIVGHGTKDNFGTYAVLELPDKGRSSAPFVVGMSGFTGVLNTRFRTELDSWRSTTVWSYPDLFELAQVKVDLPRGPGSPFTIEHLEDGRVRMLDAGGRPLPTDTGLVKMTLQTFKQLNYEIIDRDMKLATRDSLLATPPDHVVVTTDRDGRQRSVRFWYMPYTGEVDPTLAYQPKYEANRMHALVEDSLMVVIQRPLFDPILQPAENLLP
jgi:hypothetical protein